MYKLMFLSLMFVFSYSRDLVAGGNPTPWDPRPRVGNGKPENTIDDQFPPDKAEESNELNTDHAEKDVE